MEETVVLEDDADEYEKPELELDERELQREWEEMEEAVEKGDEERVSGMVSFSREGLVCCAIIVKICSSSSKSLCKSC